MFCAVCLRNHAPASGLSSCELAELDAAARGERPDVTDLIPPNSKFLEMLMRDKDDPINEYAEAAAREGLRSCRRDKDERAREHGPAGGVYGAFVTGPTPESDLRAAKERLGAWLAAEPERTWTVADDFDPVDVELHRCDPDGIWRIVSTGEGPTEAAAILAALEKVNA